MKTNFQIKALEHNEFHHLFKLTDDELLNPNAKKFVVNEKPGFPCRVSLQEANIGETIIAFPYVHHDVDSPYKASGPIFIRENVETVRLKVNEIPEILQKRFLSIRAYNSDHLMIDVATVKGTNVKKTIQGLFHNKLNQYIHIRNAKQGCFNCYVERAQ